VSHIHPVKLFLSNLIASSARGSRAPIFDKKSSLLPLMLSSVIILSACGGGGGADDGRIVGADGIARLQIPEADN